MSTNGDAPMTKGEREELAKIVRLRAKVARADADARKADLRAGFEEQLATEYKIDDERWKEVMDAGRQAVVDANAELVRRCAAAGIRPEFSPSLSLDWYNRGENRAAKRRAELRKVAETRLDAMAKTAKLEIERATAHMLSDLHSRALSTSESREWLEQMPTVEALLPPLRLAEIEAGV